MSQLSVSVVATSSPAYREVFDLREAILRRPLGLSLHNEDLSQDHTDVILAGSINGSVACCLILHEVNPDTLKLRQMAVSDTWQGKGLGRELVAAAEAWAAEHGYTTMVLHARKHATGFYETLGYTAMGQEFTEVGIPHLYMQKAL